jgi:hypothetical protein
MDIVFNKIVARKGIDGRYFLEPLPTKEEYCLLILTRDSDRYAVSFWCIGEDEESGWDGYCVDEVSAWAYLPRQIEIEFMIENELLKAQEEER